MKRLDALTCELYGMETVGGGGRAGGEYGEMDRVGGDGGTYGGSTI